jgi:hypothetical protein
MDNNDRTCAICRHGLIGVKKDLFFTPGEPSKKTDATFVRIQCRRVPTYEYRRTNEWCGEFVI